MANPLPSAATRGKSPSWGRAFTYAVLGLWSIVCLFPLYWLTIVSLTGEADIDHGPHFLPFVDFIPSLRAWVFILTAHNENLLPRFFNSAVIALTSSLLTTLAAAMAVYGLTRFRFKSWGPTIGPHGVMFALLATRVLPPAVLVLPIYLMAQVTGTLDTRFALIVTYTAINLPVAVWLLQPVLGPGASDQEEAAQLDGASQFRIFFEIVVPMAMSGLAATGLLVFILCWNEYLFAAYLAADHAMTLPPWAVGQLSLKEAQIGGEAEEWANLSAATILMALPLLGFTALAQRVLSRRLLWWR